MNPIVANNRPVKVDLTEGEEYYFCTCGRSSNQPFCDGSHVGTEFKPQPFTAEKSGDAFLCQCKHSANLPFYDGTHKQFDADAVGKEGLVSKQMRVRFPWPVLPWKSLRSSSYISWPGMACQKWGTTAL